DDEGLKYLTHEEKDVLMFFEETIDALDDALEEPALPDSGLHSQSPRSTEENVSSHSETEDIIDLVQSTPDGSDHEEPPTRDAEPDSPKAAVPAEPAPLAREMLPPPPPPPLPAVQHPRLLRSVPTPLIVAQQMSEQQQGDGRTRFPGAPKEGNPERKKTPVPNGDCAAPACRHPPAPAARLPRFPSNINITNAGGREFSETISRAAVNVQERRAQVLANIHGGAFPAAGPEERPQQADGLPNGHQNIHEILRSEPSPFLPLGKTVAIQPEVSLAANKVAQQNTAKDFPDHKQPALALDMRRRAGSLPRPSGFRPQGVTVRFSGRGSTEEARREALRKLGLLKETA
ncbi:Proline and serine-rich protein 2, partial [Tinamus guttatus]